MQRCFSSSDSFPKYTFLGIEQSMTDIIQSISRPIAIIANSVFPKLASFEQLTEVTQQLVDFLSNISFKHDMINKIYRKCSSLSFAHFQAEVLAINDALIQINLDMNLPVASCEIKSYHFINKLISFDENSFVQRSCIYFLTNVIIVDFLANILPSIKREESTQIILDLFYDRILKEIQNKNCAFLLFPIAQKWERVINKISKSAPKETYSYLLRAISQGYSSGFQMSFVFISVRSILIANIELTETKKSVNALNAAFEQLKNHKTAFFDHLTFFSCSIAAQLLIMTNGESTTHPVLAKLLTIANIEKNLAVLTIFSIFSPAVRQKISFRAISAMSASVIKTFPSQVLYAFSHVLKGPTYDLHCEDNAKTSVQFEQQELNKMFSIVVSYGSYDKARYLELTEFLVHLALANFPLFVKDYFPKLCQNDSIEMNGVSIFDTFRELLNVQQLGTQYPKEIKTIKKSLLGTTHLYLLDSNEDQSNVIFNFEQSISDPFDILKGSKPRHPVLPSAKQFHADIDSWKQQLLPSKISSNSDEECPLFGTFPTPPLKTPDILSVVDTPILHCVAILPLLGYSEKLTTAVMPLIFGKSIHLASVAFRAVQSIVFLDQRRSAQVMTRLLSLGKCETDEQLYVMLKCEQAIVQVSKFDDCLYPLIILGLCSTSHEVRNVTFSLMESSTKLSEMFKKNEKIIFEKSIEKIAAILSCDSFDASSLPFRSFRDVANSNYQNIYHVFLSVFFQNVRHPLFEESRSFIFNFKPLNPSPLFTINLSTFLVATATNDFPPQNEFNEIISKVSTTVLESGESMYLIFFSFASSVNRHRTEEIMSMLKGPNEPYLRAFSFCATLYWLREPSEELMTRLFVQCGHIVTFCDALGYFSMTEVCPISEEILFRKSCLMLNCLCDFSRLVSMLCDFYRDLHNKPPNRCPYLHKSVVVEGVGIEPYFIFLLNISLCQNKRLKRQAKTAFSSYCAIASVSDELISVILGKIRLIIKDNINAATFILAHSINKSLDFFIESAKDDHRYLVCISNLFEEVKSFKGAISKLEKFSTNSPKNNNSRFNKYSEYDATFSKTIYANTGKLLALSLLYLSGDRPGYENEALKLLVNLILSTSIIKKNQRELFIPLFDFVEQNIDNIQISFQKMQQLNDIISTAFSFCSESFLMQALKYGSCKFFVCFLKKWFEGIKIYPNSNFLENNHKDLTNDNGNSKNNSPDKDNVSPNTNLDADNIEIESPTTNVDYISLSEDHFFTPFSFIEHFIKSLCSNTLQPQFLDLVYQLSNTEIIAIYCFELSESYEEECITLLSALCPLHPRLIDMLAHFFEIKFWLYEVIQTNNKSEYVKRTNFVRHLSRKLIKNSSYAHEKLRPLLYSFYFLFENRENKHKLNSLQKEKYWKNCFDFGLLCGDFNVSIRALNYVVNNFTYAKNEYIEKIENSLAMIKDIIIETYHQNCELNNGNDDYNNSNNNENINDYCVNITNNLVNFISEKIINDQYNKANKSVEELYYDSNNEASSEVKSNKNCQVDINSDIKNNNHSNNEMNNQIPEVKYRSILPKKKRNSRSISPNRAAKYSPSSSLNSSTQSPLYNRLNANQNKMFVQTQETLLFEYTSKLLLFLSKQNTNSNNPSDEIFNIIIHFIELPDNTINEKMLNAVIDSIFDHLTRVPSIFKSIKKKMAKSKQQPSTNNDSKDEFNINVKLINALSKDTIHFDDNKQAIITVDRLFNAMCMLLSSGYNEYLSEKLEITILALFPFFRNIANFNETLSEKYPYDFKLPIGELVQEISGGLSDEDIEVVVSFFCSTFKYLREKISANIYQVCAHLILSGRKSKDFYMMMTASLHDSEKECSDAACFFLSTYQNYNENTNPNSPDLHSYHLTSHLNQKKNKTNEEKTNEEKANVTQNNKYALNIEIPTTSYDGGFQLIPMSDSLRSLTCVSRSIEKVKNHDIVPFSEWKNTYKKGKKVKCQNRFVSDSVSTPSSFLKPKSNDSSDYASGGLDLNTDFVLDFDFDFDFNSFSKPSRIKPKRCQSKQLLLPDVSLNSSAGGMSDVLKVDLNVFVPPLEEVNDIAADIIDFPSFCK